MAYSREEILAAVRQMSVLDLAELVRELQETFGVSAAPSVVVPPIIDRFPDPEPRPTAFDVILTAAGAQKIQVIKAVREVTTLGLKEAKDLVDGIPNPVKEGVDEDEAAALKEKLEAAGAGVELKPA